MRYKIGLDASGGDNAPAEMIRGAVLARKELDVDVVLIGDENEIRQQAHQLKISLDDFEIVNAPDKIDMAETPVLAVRRKKKSSIVIGSNMMKEKKLDAFVSCGNTGAMMAASVLKLGLIEGVERPGIALTLPTAKGVALVVDVGANMEARPSHLLQYGVMASLYYKEVLEKEDPTIGILNIGEEEAKGPDMLKDASKVFKASSLNFIGNVEPKEVFKGRCDCVVCDGFVGNILLKVTEGAASAIGKLVGSTVKHDIFGMLGLVLMLGTLKTVKKKVDYAEYGGAPLLGVNGVVIIGHGRSHRKAVKNAIRAAVHELRRDLNSKIKERIAVVCSEDGVKETLTSL